ncbi:MAG: flagellar hook-length control protein FliK, partial [Gemmatimonadota bacterium]
EWVLREAIRAAARSAPEIEPRPEASGDAASSSLASALQAAGGGPRGSGEAATGQAGPTEVSRAADPPAAPAPGPSRVTIPFADERGEGQVRLLVHGQAVRATIVTDDAATAQRMEAALTDLHRSLGEHGFTDAQVTIAAPRAADRMDRRVVTAGAPDAPMARADASAAPPDHRGGEPRRDDSAPGGHTAEEREAARRQSRERQKGRHP